jgi:hypothetical protein
VKLSNETRWAVSACTAERHVAENVVQY